MARRPAALLLALGAWVGLSTAPFAWAQDTGMPPILEGPGLLTYIQADYPAEALAQGVEAQVGLIIEIDETGAVIDVQVEQPAGMGFDEAAIAAVQQMRFTPARTAEGPVGVAFPFTYAFTLPEDTDTNAVVKDADRKPVVEDAPAPEGDGEPLPIVQMPSIIDYVEAPYPPEAEAAGLQATVTLVVTLSAEGTVEEVVVTGPAGQGFDEAAKAAVEQMTFAPARTEEGPVGVVFEFQYAFELAPEEPEPDQPAPVNLTGLVREMGTRKLLEGVAVSVDGTEISGTTDAEGRFALRGVPAGPQVLRLRSPEHVELDQRVDITEDELTDATLWLRARSYRDNEAVGYYQRERTEVTRHTLTIEEVKKIPGTFGDPVKVIQTLPGAARSPFGTGLLIIRGANPEDSAVYVDGIRIPIVYHLTGLTSVLSPDVVQSVDYLPGGYGVQFGRAQAATINVKTKDEFKDRKLTVGIDLLDAQVWFEGNFGKKDGPKHGFAIGARRSYVDVFIPVFTRNLGFNVLPYYWDYQTKYVAPKTDKNEFSAFIFGFQDIIKISSAPDQAQGTDVSTQGDLRTTYQSHRLVLKWKHIVNDTFDFTIQPSIGVDINNLGLGREFKLDNNNTLFQMRAWASIRPAESIELEPGLDLIGGPYYFDFRAPLSIDSLGDPLAERQRVGFDGRGSAWSPTPYLKANFRPLKDRSRWLISTGLRYNYVTYLIGGEIAFGNDLEPTEIRSIDPRIGTRLRVFGSDDGPRGTLKASTGLYHQPPQPFESIGIGTSTKLLAERAWNSSLGFEHQVSRAVSWNLEGFYRRMDRLVSFNDDFTGLGTQPFVNRGQGYAAGFELIVRHAPVNHFFGWISYTFSRSFRRDDENSDWYRFDFDQPHIFSAQGGYDFPFDIGLSAQIQVVSGNPTTPFNAGIYDIDGDFYNGFRIGAGNSDRLPTFVQTSFRVDKTFTFKRWQLEIYLDLINAIRGVNPETTVYNYDYSQFAYVRGLPFLPNLGLEFRVWP